MEIKRILRRLLILYVILCSCNVTQAQEGADTRREEIQRYFGYEALPYRYISLPFDVSVNVNEKGDFVDIGPLYLMFIPILILFLLIKRKLTFGLGIAAMVTFLILSLSNSQLLLNLNEVVRNDKSSLTEFLLSTCSDLNCYLTSFSAYFYYLSHLIFDPINAYIMPYTGDVDHFTYPLVFGIFIYSIFFTDISLKKKSPRFKILAILFLLMTFFWMTFSAGIIWYGFPMLVLGMFLIFALLKTIKKRDEFSHMILAGAFYSFSLIWLFFVGAQRISAVNAGITADRMGKNMYQPYLFQYMSGAKNSNEIFDGFYPNLRETIDLMNQETESRIYRIGTSFSFFIKSNSERIQIDNQLGIFEKLNAALVNKHDVADALKANGFKYMIIDLNTPFIDKTPEQSLQIKYRSLMRFVKDNKRLKLLSTNRIIVEDENGVPKYFYGVWGHIHYGGQYAVYELI